MDLVDELFVAAFDHLNKTFQKEFDMIKGLYPFEPLKVMIQFYGFDFSILDTLNLYIYKKTVHFHVRSKIITVLTLVYLSNMFSILLKL